MIETFAETDGDELASGDLEGVGCVCQFEWNRNVFQGRHIGDEMEGLENNADVAATKIRQRVLAKLVQFRIRDDDFAAIEPLETGKHHQKRRFSRSGGANDTNRLALSD